MERDCLRQVFPFNRDSGVAVSVRASTKRDSRVSREKIIKNGFVANDSKKKNAGKETNAPHDINVLSRRRQRRGTHDRGSRFVPFFSRSLFF